MKSGTNEGSGVNAHLTFADVDDDQAIIFKKDEGGPTAAYYANTGRLSTKSKTDILDIKNKEVPGFKDIDTNPENSSYTLSYTGR